MSVGAAADIVVWEQSGPAFAGAHTDPVEAWLRCGPAAARQTIVAGRLVVDEYRPTHHALAEMLARHAAVSRRLQGLG